MGRTGLTSIETTYGQFNPRNSNVIVVETYMHLRWMKTLTAAFCLSSLYAGAQSHDDIHNSQVRISLSCGQGCLWQYRAGQRSEEYRFAPPEFSIDGHRVSARVSHFVQTGTPIHLDNGVTEYSFAGALAQDSHLQLQVQFQVNDETPMIRFRYTLKADQPRT